jgi:hypothetical protein
MSRHNPAATPGKHKTNTKAKQDKTNKNHQKPPKNKQNHKQRKVIGWPVQQRQSKEER